MERFYGFFKQESIPCLSTLVLCYTDNTFLWKPHLTFFIFSCKNHLRNAVDLQEATFNCSSATGHAWIRLHLDLRNEGEEAGISKTPPLFAWWIETLLSWFGRSPWPPAEALKQVLQPMTGRSWLTLESAGCQFFSVFSSSWPWIHQCPSHWNIQIARSQQGDVCCGSSWEGQTWVEGREEELDFLLWNAARWVTYFTAVESDSCALAEEQLPFLEVWFEILSHAKLDIVVTGFHKGGKISCRF